MPAEPFTLCTTRRTRFTNCAFRLSDWPCRLPEDRRELTPALATTTILDMGLGIVPTAVRNPVYLAMEFAVLDPLSGAGGEGGYTLESFTACRVGCDRSASIRKA